MLAVERSPIVRSPALNVLAVAIGLPELLANELRLLRFGSCAWPRWRRDEVGQAADWEEVVETADPRRRGSKPEPEPEPEPKPKPGPGGGGDGPEEDVVELWDQADEWASQSPKSVL